MMPTAVICLRIVISTPQLIQCWSDKFNVWALHKNVWSVEFRHYVLLLHPPPPPHLKTAEISVNASEQSRDSASSGKFWNTFCLWTLDQCNRLRIYLCSDDVLCGGFLDLSLFALWALCFHNLLSHFFPWVVWNHPLIHEPLLHYIGTAV